MDLETTGIYMVTTTLTNETVHEEHKVEAPVQFQFLRLSCWGWVLSSMEASEPAEPLKLLKL